MPQPYVLFDNVCKYYQMGDTRIAASDHVSFSIQKGEFCVILGPSGAGKTTVLNMLGGMDTCDEGTILLDGERVSDFDQKRLTTYRRYDVGFVFQFYNLVQNLTARENVELKNRLTGFKTPEQIARMFEALEIDNRIDTPVGRLSIGQQQRVAIIRTLCQPFDFILLDEPVSHLDARNNDIAARLIADEAAAQGAAIIATSVGYDININFNYSLRL